METAIRHDVAVIQALRRGGKGANSGGRGGRRETEASTLDSRTSVRLRGGCPNRAEQVAERLNRVTRNMAATQERRFRVRKGLRELHSVVLPRGGIPGLVARGWPAFCAIVSFRGITLHGSVIFRSTA
ncbi:hypothetical protein PInf_007153 [Phytophthora infestans]|nr:hypothetical protein PInf_007153 [Phytophthora infestans]